MSKVQLALSIAKEICMCAGSCTNPAFGGLPFVVMGRSLVLPQLPLGLKAFWFRGRLSLAHPQLPFVCFYEHESWLDLLTA